MTSLISWKALMLIPSHGHRELDAGPEGIVQVPCLVKAQEMESGWPVWLQVLPVRSKLLSPDFPSTL